MNDIDVIVSIYIHIYIYIYIYGPELDQGGIIRDIYEDVIL